MTPTDGRATDLRIAPIGDVLDRVERSLHVHLDRNTLVRKRRSIGARTNRDSWVRIERRPVEKILGQGWNGTECASALGGIAKPEWQESVSWRDPVEATMWRADETGLLPGPPIGSSVLATDPQLPEAWWQSLTTSLDALAGQDTTRVATPDTEVITQTLVTTTVQTAFPTRADTTIRRWSPAHADLNWANITAPHFCLFDWEDWGMAPRGLDSASLLGASLAVPTLADRVRSERRDDLESRDGKVMTLFVFAKFAGADAHPDDPRVEPARREAARIVSELQSA
ncbi:hypothetical protein [Kitasatospora sp. NPDC090091]|uniref:hypothetical protein n=1 Tax=Kitasatospora sp. NPDC090091 TaxID=3364081 RepID=UPI003804D9AE